MKDYVEPMTALFDLSEGEHGSPQYFNEAKNFVEIGSRGGGKTYSEMLGGFFYDIVFDGQKNYEPGVINTGRAVLEITSGQESKSAEALDKLKFAMDALATKADVGVWGDPDDPYATNYKPCPFYKFMRGSLSGNNRKDPWINEYDAKVGNGWKKKGSRSVVYHTIYSINDRGGGQKSAGGRRTYVLHEEGGLNERLIEAWTSNEGLISGDGKKYASQKGIGTSGNLRLVMQMRRLAENPKEFSAISLPHHDDATQPFGFFLPAYMTDRNFKDDDGNTNIDAAKEHWEYLHAEKMGGSSADVYYDFCMNYPIRIEHMWVEGYTNILPSKEAEVREKELLQGDLYKTIGTPVKLHYDDASTHKVSWTPDTSAIPFYHWPLELERKTLDAVFMMYIKPEELMINGRIPDDMIIVNHDPYVAEEWDKGGSLGVAHFIVSPKYIGQGFPGHKIAATYIGKPEQGLDEYNRTLLMGSMMYGRPKRSIWYEANRGSDLRSMAIHMNCMDMLCLRPQFSDGKFIYEQRTTQTGFMIGNNISKSWMLTRYKYYLLSSCNSDGMYHNDPENKDLNGIEQMDRLIIQNIDCIFTIRQIKMFNHKGNFDAVSSHMAAPLAIGEIAHHVRMGGKKSNKNLSLLSRHAEQELKRNGYGLRKLSQG
jgi:hypothetical protein